MVLGESGCGVQAKKVEEGEGGGGAQKKGSDAAGEGRRGAGLLEEEGSPAARAVWPFRGKVRSGKR